MRFVLLLCYLLGYPLAQALHLGIPEAEEVPVRAVERLRVAGGKVKVQQRLLRRPTFEVDFWGSAKDFARVTQLKSARTIVLDGRAVTDVHLEHLIGLKQLEVLELHDTFVSDSGLARLNKLTQLREVHWALGWSVTDRGLSELGKLKNLESLSVTQVTRASDAWLKDLKGLVKLRKLDVERMAITDRGVELLSRLPALEYLDLSETSVTDGCLRHLQKMRKLRFVSLANTEVTARALQVFRQERPDVRIEFYGEE